MNNRIIGRLAFITATMVAISANAITLPTSSSAPLIINFDLSSLSPTPPYDNIVFHLDTYNGANPDGKVFVELFGERNGANYLTYGQVSPQFWHSGETQFNFAPNSPQLAGIYDGIFSVGIYAEKSNIDFQSISVRGVTLLPAVTVTPDQTVGFASAVPEPSTGGLTIAGLLTVVGFLAGARRRLSEGTKPAQ